MKDERMNDDGTPASILDHRSSFGMNE